ncbi:hypothetical protein ACF3VQ_21695 (plasmid) [Yersinia sp. HM-2024]|uniref:hypothetical protein n=1 Tax=Yersinia sp. HM-2024 TaxID=3344550 RepID=UPI00370D3132
MNKDEMKKRAENILHENQTIIINCGLMNIRARPALPHYEIRLNRDGLYTILKGTELSLRQWNYMDDGYRLDLLDCHSYPCAVHIASITLNQNESQHISEQLNLTIKDSRTEQPMEDIRLEEKTRLLRIKNIIK